MTTPDTIIRRPDGELYDYISMATASNEVLEELLRSGVQPDTDDLAGWEFRGFNVPDLLTMVGNKKFKSGFVANGDGGVVHGYQVFVRQNRLGEAWIDKIRHGESVKHSFSNVYPVRNDEVDNLYPNALLLNYASDRSAWYSPARVRRDYVVQVYVDNNDLLLGKAYAAIGGRRVAVAFFVLERYNPSTL